jgi:hypothetical protein
MIPASRIGNHRVFKQFVISMAPRRPPSFLRRFIGSNRRRVWKTAKIHNLAFGSLRCGPVVGFGEDA